MDLGLECVRERNVDFLPGLELLITDSSASELLNHTAHTGIPAVSSADFRPIHYIGSKLRMLPSIMSALDSVDPSGGPVCDLFAGSGTVSFAASRQREVVAVDIQAYSRVLCSAVIGGHMPPAELQYAIETSDRLRALIAAALPLLAIEESALRSAVGGHPEPICELVEHGSILEMQMGGTPHNSALNRAKLSTLRNLRDAGLAGVESVCLRHYGGTFFSYRQALVLDAAASVCRTDYGSNDAALAIVLGTASQIVNTVGKQFAQPLQPRAKDGKVKLHLLRKMVTDRSRNALQALGGVARQYEALPLPHSPNNRAYMADYLEALPEMKGRVSVVYADPPYTRDHYSRFYHVLETIARSDDPDVSMSNLGEGTRVSRGMYRKDRYQSDFCIKSKAPNAFMALFQEIKAIEVPLVLSYSSFDDTIEGRPRVLAIKDLLNIAKNVFSRVSVEEVSSLVHSKLNRENLNKNSGGTTEVLITCQL